MSNPVVLITGGLSGIGRAAAIAFAATAPAQISTLIGRGVPSADQPTAALAIAPAPN